MGCKLAADVEDAWREHWGVIHEVIKVVLIRKGEPPPRRKMRELNKLFDANKVNSHENSTTRKVSLVSSADEEKKVEAKRLRDEEQRRISERCWSRQRCWSRAVIPAYTSMNIVVCILTSFHPFD